MYMHGKEIFKDYLNILCIPVVSENITYTE